MSNNQTPGTFSCAHLAIVTVRGEEAEKFLQGQLTTDLRNLAPGDNRLAMHLNLKGRAMVSMRLFRTDSGFDLVTPAGKAEAVMEGLKKYALFSKVTLSLDDSRVALGFIDEKAAADHHAYSLHEPDSSRWMALVAKDSPAVSEEFGDAAGWQSRDIDAGVAHVYPGGEDLWLPQALNYDLMDGVHFNKGCFLGQEVVARMHFKGQMKQRMRAWRWPGDVVPATGTVLRNAEGKAVGELVQAVSVDGMVKALVVTRLDHSEDLILDGQPLNAEEVALPYSLPEN